MSDSREDFLIGQKWFIDDMHQLKYRTNEEGMCAGYADNVMLLWLSSTKTTVEFVTRFNEFIDSIRYIPVEKIEMTIAYTQEKYKSRLKEAQINSWLEIIKKYQIDNQHDLWIMEFTNRFQAFLESIPAFDIGEFKEERFAFHEIFDAYLKEIESKVIEITNNETTKISEERWQLIQFEKEAIYKIKKEESLEKRSQWEKFLIQINAFFEPIHVIANKRELKKVWGTSVNFDTLHHLILPSNIDSVNVDNFVGLNSTDDLQKSLELLTSTLNSTHSRIVFRINANLHAIFIGYDPKEKCWLFGDPDQELQIVAVDQLANKIMGAYFEEDELKNKTLSFSAQIFVANVDQENLLQIQKALTECMATIAWNNIYDSPEKAFLVDSEGTTLLWTACKSGNVACVNKLLALGVKVNYAGPDGLSPLHVAIDSGSLEIVEKLLAKDADPNFASRLTPFALAVHQQHHAMVNMILKSSKINLEAPSLLGPPLHIAVFRQDIQLVKMLLEAGANPNSVDNEGKTAIRMAAKNGDYAILHLLLNQGAELAYNKKGFTIFHQAIRKKRYDLIRELLSSYDLNKIWIPAKTGITPLFLAILTDDKTLVAELASYNIPAINHIHSIPFQLLGNFAKRRNCIQQFILLCRQKFSTLPPEAFLTPLHLAIICGNDEIINFLLKNGAQKNTDNTTFSTDEVNQVFNMEEKLPTEENIDQPESKSRKLN